MSVKYYNVRLTAILKAETPILVSDGDDGLDNQIRACFDKTPKPYLPGSGIKGSLNALVAGQSQLQWIFGEKPPAKSGPEEKNTGKAGKVRFMDACWSGNPPAEYQTRVRNSINPVTGAAEKGHLVQLNMLAKGSRFEIELLLENATAEELSQLKGLLAAWGKAANNLGTGANQNYGSFELDPASITVTGIAAEDYIRWLGSAELPRGKPSTREVDVESQAISLLDSRIELKIKLYPLAPIFVGDESMEVHHPEEKEPEEPTILKPKLDDDGRLVLPSTGLRGVLRSQARRILATLFELQPSQKPPLMELFGSTERKARLKITDFIADKADKNPQKQTLLGIDRFTGGVKAGATFNIERHDINYLTGRISLTADLLGEPRRAELGLMLLLLRDLLDGELSIGAHKARGFGKVQGEIHCPCFEQPARDWCSFSEQWQKQDLPDMESLMRILLEQVGGCPEVVRG